MCGPTELKVTHTNFTVDVSTECVQHMPWSTMPTSYMILDFIKDLTSNDNVNHMVEQEIQHIIDSRHEMID